MEESEPELVRFLYYIVSMPSRLHWEVLLFYLEEIKVEDRENSFEKGQIHLLHSFCLEFSFSSLQQRSCTLFRIPKRSDLGFLKFRNVSFNKPGTYHLVKKTDLGKKIFLHFSLILYDRCTLLLFLQLTKEMKRKETLPLLAYLFSFQFGTVYISLRTQSQSSFGLAFQENHSNCQGSILSTTMKVLEQTKEGEKQYLNFRRILVLYQKKKKKCPYT